MLLFLLNMMISIVIYLLCLSTLTLLLREKLYFNCQKIKLAVFSLFTKLLCIYRIKYFLFVKCINISRIGNIFIKTSIMYLLLFNHIIIHMALYFIKYKRLEFLYTLEKLIFFFSLSTVLESSTLK